MTPCEKLGYKVGDKFEVMVDQDGRAKNGMALTLDNDDGTDNPLFSGPDEDWIYFAHIDEVKKITTENKWIEWHGGECPVKKGALVDVRLRHGGVYFSQAALYDNERASSPFWRRDYVNADIIAYRLSDIEKEVDPGADKGKAGVSTDTPTVTRHDIIDAIFETGTIIDLSDAMEIAETIVSKFELKRVEK